MEEQQVAHIKKNIVRLTTLTTCNVAVITALKAEDMLSKAETEQIDAKVSYFENLHFIKFDSCKRRYSCCKVGLKLVIAMRYTEQI